MSGWKLLNPTTYLHKLNWAPVSINNFNYSFTCNVTVFNDTVAALYSLPLQPRTSGAGPMNPWSVFRTNTPPPKTTCNCEYIDYMAKITACVTSDSSIWISCNCTLTLATNRASIINCSIIRIDPRSRVRKAVFYSVSEPAGYIMYLTGPLNTYSLLLLPLFSCADTRAGPLNMFP